jgi:hypothetical protein
MRYQDRQAFCCNEERAVIANQMVANATTLAPLLAHTDPRVLPNRISRAMRRTLQGPARSARAVQLDGWTQMLSVQKLALLGQSLAFAPFTAQVS